MKFINVIVFLVSLLCLSSCETDFEVNADWKEIPVVYGLLNAGKADSVQYIRVMKAYLNTNTDAVEIAKIPDSLYFDSLEVSVVDMVDGNRVIYVPDYSLSKDTGLFQSAYNKLYRSPAGMAPLNPEHRYRLEITNIYSGKKTLSETDMVGAATPVYPNITTNVVDFRPNNFPRPFQWVAGKNARIYDAELRLVYDEIRGSDTVPKFVDMVAANAITTGSLDGDEVLSFNLTGLQFYAMVAAYIKADPAVKRRANSLVIRYFGGSDDLNTYMSVNKPTIGIVQKKPEFTNVNGGYGIFSSRHTMELKNIQLSDSTQYYLKVYPSMVPLNFITP